ncbi:ferrochelatase [Ilumatobacter sp.]|uniref:ferrochelatase n=1 Tax=Ilumatobacter sp. TaxID=1967498 RepID=UPI0026237359|nr:ferrochelatase [Ilumatobacter sp.]
MTTIALTLTAGCGSGSDDSTGVTTAADATTLPAEPAASEADATTPPADETRVALVFVGHGEPVHVADGDVPISFPDGSEFGPHGASLGAPVEMQHTEWAAAYDEIAMAMTYMFPDVNNNGVEHEMEISPAGDVPPFFTWEAFHDEVIEIYESFGDYSPHNDRIAEHVAAVDVAFDGADVVTHLAFLDAVPRIPDVMWDIAQAGDYDAVAVVPLLLATSTHTQEVEDQIEEVAALVGGLDVVVTPPFYEVPEMRAHVKNAVVNMATELRASVPDDASDELIGVVLAAHGTPYVPADPSAGWKEGEIFSNLGPTEDEFHDEIAAELHWTTRTGRMNYDEPSIEESLSAFEADGIEHVLVVPSAFPTPAMHTMYDVATPAVGRPVTPDEGVVVVERPSGMHVYYCADGYADLDVGRDEFRAGLTFIAQRGVETVLGQS